MGGKAAGLAGLVGAGLPVPAGFVVLAGAYRRFVEAAGLDAAIESMLAAAASGEVEAAGAARSLAERVTEAAMPAEIADEMRAAYGALGRPTVAVRSSSVQEDLGGASFAGQYATVLDVTGEEALLEAVVRCWASAWSPAVLAYRAARGLGGDIDHAVVVQRQVAGDRAGVLFTSDPVTGRRDRVRVSSAWGLGQAVVDGAVTPDEWLVDTSGLQVISREIADKAVWTAPTEDGSATVAAPEAQRQVPSLSDAEAIELARLGLRAQAVFGTPQDLEWVAEDGELLLVQSRPLTTLFPLPAPLPAPAEGLRLYLSFNRVAQGFVEPMTPMGNEVWRLVFAAIGQLAYGRRRASSHPKVFRLAAGRVYLDFTGPLRRPRLRQALLADLVGAKDPPAARALEQLVERERLGGRPEGPLTWRLALLVPGIVGRLVAGALLPELAAARASQVADQHVDRLQREANGLTGVSPRLAWLEREAITPMRVVLAQMGWLGIATRAAAIAEAALAPHVGASEAMAAVHRSPHHNPTSEMNRDLLETALRLRDAEEQPTTDSAAVAEFLARYGHRAVREIDVGLPRWREEPALVLAWVGEAAADPDLDERLAGQREAVTAADQRASATLTRVPGRLRRAFIGWHLRRARTLVGLRERPKFDEARSFEIFRRVLLDVGAVLVADDRLDTAGDVMQATVADIRSDGDLREITARNRQHFQAELQRTSIPRVMTSAGETIYAAEAASEHDLSGVGVSPGTAEGRVRVITEPRAGALEPGEILVTHSTDPMWTPIMLRAGGLIMETGGPLMHGAIVAREQGIPAVAGIEHVTQRLTDGDHVRIDGEAGTITRR